MPNAYPLSWPNGWRRTAPLSKKFGHFRRDRRDLTLADGRKRLLESIRLFGVKDYQVIVSTNVPLRNDGLPRSGQKDPSDAGVAVYWKTEADNEYKVMAIDQYTTVADNLAAISATLDAMRAIKRHGGAVILERAFAGFTALPSPYDWRQIMGIGRTPLILEEVRAIYRHLAKRRHPDHGGSEAAMAELNQAMEEAQRELGIK